MFNNNGTIPKTASEDPASIAEKLAKSFKIKCPAIILANKRMLKLKGRARYEINSITIINGAKNTGMPFGKKR